MKVYLNKYRYHWVSPYTICEKICFWREIDYDEPWVKSVNMVLEPICTAWMKFLDVVHPKIDYVKIDKWDTWNMDSTLSPIILPMLKQLHKHKHGAPNTDDEDVPPTLRSTTKSAQKAKKNPWDSDGNHFKRWDWIMSEMIWAFEQLCQDDWEKQYCSGNIDHKWVDTGDGCMTLKKGPKHTYKIDSKSIEKHQKRINNGLRLFGKYYQGLWD
jgi:hypothetical protein